jgi:hypothetical protein
MVNPRVLEYETLIALNQLKLRKTATVMPPLKHLLFPYQSEASRRGIAPASDHALVQWCL